MSWYDTAQICTNGHLINCSYNREPEDNKEYCTECGAKTIISCPECSKSIQGAWYADLNGFPELPSEIDVPKFCNNCGSAMPWTKSKVEVAKELALEMEGLDEQQRSALAASIDFLIADTPRTELEATRFKKLMSNAQTQAAKVLLDLISSVTSETVKKLLWP